MSKKFNIKDLIKVSAVALALISGGAMLANATGNNTANADDIENGIDYTMANKLTDKSVAKNDKLNDAYEAKLRAEDEPNRKAEALSELKQGEDLDPDLAKDPVVKGYLESKGYSDAQIKNSMDTPAKDKAEQDSTENYVERVQKDPGGVMDHITKRSRSSRSTVRKPKITNDAQAIRNDQKQLSTRKAKQAIRNYKHNHKATRYIKSLISANKDLTKRENHLTRLTKRTRKARATKRNSRRSLKRVRKTNRKNKNAKRTRRNKRNHKRIIKRNRNRKHLKRNARKHIRRNLRHRK